MKEKKKTLLDLDRVPTLDELRAFFRENDFSAAAYMDIDYEKLDAGTVEALEYIKSMMDEKWEPLSHEMGLKASSCYYGKDNPLIAMRDNMENLVASGVLKLLERSRRPLLVLRGIGFPRSSAFRGHTAAHRAAQAVMK